MSHVINQEIFADSAVNTKQKRDLIKAHWDEVVSHEDYMEGAIGLPYPIQWQDHMTPFEDVCAAKEYIRKMSLTHSYLQIAVPFYKPGKKTKAIERLEEKLQKASTELSDLDDRIYYTPATIKSQFITCKECGSKLSVKHLNRNYCPVCRHDLRPDTFHSKIAKMREKIVELTEKIRDCAKKSKGQKKYWLVKIEYHV